MRSISNYTLSRLFLAAEGDKPKTKRMVLLIGPPAAGKGLFVGEQEKDRSTGETKKYKTESGVERDTKPGWRLPQTTKGLFRDEDIPDHPEADESDNHLHAFQFEESRNHFDELKAAHDKGREDFDKALNEMWYDTKDGDRITLRKAVKGLSFDTFPEDHQGYFAKTNKDFYISMRGWHDDTQHHNPETGKAKERFKDLARHSFDDAVNHKTEDSDSGLLTIDSAGEDIDAQDFKGQIEAAKSNGYEVSVIFLHPEQADTELSNLFRGKVNGKRMVDQEDITNWYKQNEAALKDIQAATPDNFLHYRRPPPDSDPKKAAEMRDKARDLLLRYEDMPKGAEKDAALKEIDRILYSSIPYELQKNTSWAKTLPAADLPKEPKTNVAKVVAEQNKDAEARFKKFPSKTPSKTEKVDKREGDVRKDEKSHTRMDFLHDVGDRLVPNPNPDGRKSQVKIRSLDWKDQKRYYEQWSDKQAATASRIASRFLRDSLPERVMRRYIAKVKGS